MEGYGLTECSPVTHANPIWDKRKNGSIGLPWPDTECRVVDPETGEELEAGVAGVLQVKGPQVMKGYWNRKEETEKCCVMVGSTQEISPRWMRMAIFTSWIVRRI